MPNNRITIHYKLLPKLNPEDETERARYDCDACDDDVFILDLHALMHDTELYEVDEAVFTRPVAPPFHPCGIYGCKYPPHKYGRHSWQPLVEGETDGIEAQAEAPNS